MLHIRVQSAIGTDGCQLPSSKPQWYETGIVEGKLYWLEQVGTHTSPCNSSPHVNSPLTGVCRLGQALTAMHKYNKTSYQCLHLYFKCFKLIPLQIGVPWSNCQRVTGGSSWRSQVEFVDPIRFVLESQEKLHSEPYTLPWEQTGASINDEGINIWQRRTTN